MKSPSNQIIPPLILIDKNSMDYPDVYLTHSYAKLYEEKEQGIAQTVSFQNPFGKVEYTFIKREVPFLIDGKQYYDLTTAYGYGGPHIVESTDSKQLMEQFNEAFHSYCQRNDIVSEFVRFHLFENHEVQQNLPGEVQLIGHHVVRDLTQPLEKNFHKSIGNSVRKALRNGITVTFDTTGDSLQHFLDIYHQTMDRNNANDYYYFQDEFFEHLHQALPGNFLYAHAMIDGEIVSSFLTIVSEYYAYGFLGGTLDEYFSYNPATLLEYQIIEWLKEKGQKYYVLGGGYRGDDGLYKFKKKFDLQGDYPFYIGKRIHNEQIYQRLVDIRSAKGEWNTDSKFFPLYRI